MDAIWMHYDCRDLKCAKSWDHVIMCVVMMGVWDQLCVKFGEHELSRDAVLMEHSTWEICLDLCLNTILVGLVLGLIVAGIPCMDRAILAVLDDELVFRFTHGLNIFTCLEVVVLLLHFLLLWWLFIEILVFLHFLVLWWFFSDLLGFLCLLGFPCEECSTPLHVTVVFAWKFLAMFSTQIGEKLASVNFSISTLIHLSKLILFRIFRPLLLFPPLERFLIEQS